MALNPLENRIGNRITELEQIGSTNDLAREWIENDLARHGEVIFTTNQTAGRGQMGKSWVSERGQNIAMTLLLENNRLPDPAPFHLSVCIALSCQKVLNTLTMGDCTIKWPNDLYWKRRKLGGLLIETQKKWALVGIGINVNQSQFPPSLPNPVSLRQITGQENDPKSIASEILDSMNNTLTFWEKNRFDILLKQYRSLLFGKNETFPVIENGAERTIRILDVDDQGGLIVEENDQRKTLVSGLEWIITP